MLVAAILHHQFFKMTIKKIYGFCNENDFKIILNSRLELEDKEIEESVENLYDFLYECVPTSVLDLLSEKIIRCENDWYWLNSSNILKISKMKKHEIMKQQSLKLEL